MANIYAVRNLQTKEKAPVAIFGKVSIGAVGAPTLFSAQSNKGIKSIARTGVGAYTIHLGNAVAVDTYIRLMMAKFAPLGATSTTALGGMQIIADNSATLADPNLQVKFLDNAGAAVELGNGEVILLEMIFSNSTAF